MISKECRLIEAARKGNLSLVTELHLNGININVNNDYVLRLAAKNGHLEVVKYLLQNGANVNADNDCALGWAAYNGHLEVVKYLLQNGANINANDDYALRWAAYRGDLDTVKYLLQSGANINETNKFVHFVKHDGQYLFMKGFFTFNQEKELRQEIQLEINNFNQRIIRTKSANKN